jgi:TolB-like protein/Flp pilus assembly protein TadD
VRSDRPIASELARALEDAGLSVWWDRHIQAGADFSAEIEREIEAARVVVVLWSEASRDSQWVRDEAAYARDRRKLIPVQLDASEPPLGFRQVQSLRLDVGDGAAREQAFSELVLAAAQMAQREHEHVARTRTAGAPVRRRWLIATFATVLLATIAWLLVSHFTVAPPRTAGDPIGSPPPLTSKSIAVLPFTDMSQAKDQEFLADGMAEEIINVLAKAPDLLVTARTSSFHFKGTQATVPAIARELGVAHVLEGSIRRAGDQLRVTAQLIRADSGYHLWSETYDRELRDVFKTQTDIADAVAQALRIKLKGGELNREKGGTQNLEAYELYLRAKSATYEYNDPSLDAAIGYLKQAVTLDPQFGLAWAWLSYAESARGDNLFGDPRPMYEQARQHAEHALELSPEIAEAHASLSQLYRVLDWDWVASETAGRRAIALDPTNPDVLTMTGFNALVLGRFDDAEQQLRTALTRDPLNTYVIQILALTLFSMDRLAESEALLRNLLEIAPGFAETRPALARVLVAQGRADEALAIIQQEQHEGWRLFVMPIVLDAAGRKAEADAALQAQIESMGGCAVARTYAYRREYDLAAEWLERCADGGDIGIFWIISEPLFRPMADLPRYKALLRRMHLDAT